MVFSQVFRPGRSTDTTIAGRPVPLRPVVRWLCRLGGMPALLITNQATAIARTVFLYCTFTAPPSVVAHILVQSFYSGEGTVSPRTIPCSAVKWSEVTPFGQIAMDAVGPFSQHSALA